MDRMAEGLCRDSAMDSKLQVVEEARQLANKQHKYLVKSVIAADKSSAEVLLPGLAYTDFDKKINGKWTTWSIAKTLESVRFSVMHRGLFNIFHSDIIDQPISKYSIFLVSSRIQFYPQIHTIRAKTHWGPKMPLYFKLRLRNIGSSSFTFETVMFDARTGITLASNVLKFVYVDLTTRKPAQLPEAFEHYRTYIDKTTTNSIKKPGQMRIAEGCSRSMFRAVYSDIDGNGHVNQSAYIRWCMDAGAQASVSGHYRTFNEDIGVYDMKLMTIYYIGEATIGENVFVHTWEDTDKRGTLHFVMCREDIQIFIATFIYPVIDITSHL